MTHSLDHAERACAVAYDVAGQVVDPNHPLCAAMLAYADERVAAALRGREQVVEVYREALEEIAQSVDAYPESVFAEPDMAKAHALLVAGGMTLDAVSASNMRHIARRLGEAARAALDAEEAGE